MVSSLSTLHSINNVAAISEKMKIPLPSSSLRFCRLPSSHGVLPAFLPLPLPKNGRTLFSSASVNAIPISGAEEATMGFIMGRLKATEVAHSVWKNIVSKGDKVVDATCGNGYDTLELLNLVADESSSSGFVYGLDIQKTAIESTSSLLDENVCLNKRGQVKLFHLCHSNMEDVIPENTCVRLVTFNLGYLPGGDKQIITMPETTSLALQAAGRILVRGGLISVIVYVGHRGGRTEYEVVQSFASGLPVESWVSCKLEVVNRPKSPILVLMFKI